VPMGKRKANEIDNAIGINTIKGESPYLGPTQANDGNKTFAAATFDMKFVHRQAITEETVMSAFKFFGPEAMISSAKNSVSPDSCDTMTNKE
jgi:hypothetical protein